MSALKNIMKWIGGDVAVLAGVQGIKAIGRHAFASLSEEAGKQIGSKAAEKAVEVITERLMPPTEDDEIRLRDARLILDAEDPEYFKAWEVFLISLEDPTREDGGLHFKEYMRRYVCADNVQQTAAVIKSIAGMSDPGKANFIRAIDLKYKADVKIASPLLTVWKKIGEAGSGVAARFEAFDAEISGKATQMKTWREKRRINRGQI